MEATLKIPPKVISHLRDQVMSPRRGDVYEGFGWYGQPLLATYPRCATNWVRYFIETVSGYPTPGQVRKVRGVEHVLDRAHRAYPRMHKYKQVILVLRDYKECLLRQNRPHWLEHENVAHFLTCQDYEIPCNWYIKNLEAFDRFQGEKLLIYYEDLLAAPDQPFRRLGQFLDLSEFWVEDFLANITEHREMSVQAYTAGGHRSETARTRDPKAHSKKLLTPQQELEFDNFFLDHYRHLTRTYLTRYQHAQIKAA